MKISFHGGARTVTGSKHIIELNNGKKILLDCGMFQGMGRDTDEMNRHFGFNPMEISHVIVSHAHIDHIGLLPRLHSEGYEGKIYCSEATAALAEILLEDSAYIQEGDVEYVNKKRRKLSLPLEKPLYTQEDVRRLLHQLKPVPMNAWYEIDDQIKVMHTDAGHIIGSTCVHLEILEDGATKRITFSGDIGRYDDAILKAPETFPQADVILMESTYGDKLHDKERPTLDDFHAAIVETCVMKKGKMVIPSFSVGRTQELLYALNHLFLQGRLPNIAYYVDSPLSVEATQMTKQFPKLFNAEVREILKRDDDPFLFPGLFMVRSVVESKQINERTEPCVIISASGMAEAGRVKHHIANNILDRKNTILFVGYCEPTSLGGRLKNGIKEVSIFGKKFDVVAEVRTIDSMSAHGDANDMLQWLDCQDPQQVQQIFLVHGEYEVQQKFREKLMAKGFRNVAIPERHQTFDI